MNGIFIDYLEQIEKSLHIALPENPNNKWKNNSFFSLNDCVTQEHIGNLINPCLSLVNLGGKRWRPLLMVLCAQMARESGRKNSLTEDEIFSLAPIVEFAHTASLIHDDIEDSAETRRGKPSAHITYGLDTALNAGSWLYFEATTVIENLKTDEKFKNRIFLLYMTLLRRLHLGQAMDIYWHKNPDLIPSIEEYTQMVICKTGTLSRLAVQVGLLAGGATDEEIEKAGKIAEIIGEGFQILDDVQNLTTGNPGKKRGDDIVEGKKSLPVLLHIKENPCDKEKITLLFEKANREGINSSAVEKCIHLLESKGAIQKAKEIGKNCISENSNLLTCVIQEGKGNASSLIQNLFDEMSLKM